MNYFANSKDKLNGRLENWPKSKGSNQSVLLIRSLYSSMNNIQLNVYIKEKSLTVIQNWKQQMNTKS
ncbi:hypothetical protein CLI91_00275 [Lentilactobacillus hilgardii]|uniref:Uncharacterized protein n=1 Tax=Lentilactobacillus hilgardii TaxID=1588 RepID=A0A6P1E9B2_LENHI|nr:hypothetical protein HMPREF0496_0152 [Lentilactobacillus hilgardii ATCC 27305]MBZ2199806.1 hypothetical protein [Lentilactobacillus hilgardii]RRG11289.1 MAG: hypothetical protein DUD35_07340 [Lactobacillus sp.]MBZ2203700.1 hypothetical protein [Lentilactobacillus hilgardii]MCT3391294.1 hypothetical protein [Lentilactobacillus hilgardii]